MNRKKCANCGLVSAVSEEVCKRCSHKLDEKWEPVDRNWTPPKQKRSFPVMPFVLVAVIAGGGYAFWQLRPATESKQPAAAIVPASNGVSAEKPALAAAIEPANTQQQTVGIKATFENSKALNAANTRVEEMNKLMSSQPVNTQK